MKIVLSNNLDIALAVKKKGDEFRQNVNDSEMSEDIKDYIKDHMIGTVRPKADTLLAKQDRKMSKPDGFGKGGLCGFGVLGGTGGLGSLTKNGAEGRSVRGEAGGGGGGGSPLAQQTNRGNGNATGGRGNSRRGGGNAGGGGGGNKLVNPLPSYEDEYVENEVEESEKKGTLCQLTASLASEDVYDNPNYRGDKLI